jgi:hypothetical protein
MPPRGLEPPRPYGHRPSTCRVCQFRHGGDFRYYFTWLLEACQTIRDVTSDNRRPSTFYRRDALKFHFGAEQFFEDDLRRPFANAFVQFDGGKRSVAVSDERAENRAGHRHLGTNEIGLSSALIYRALP